jgi:hypothetical protein
MSELTKIPQGDSLILGNGVALELALGDVDEAGLPAEAYQRAEEFGRFTGERIFSGNPKLYRAIVALLGRRVPYREISEICSVSVNTVCAVSLREGVPIETIRETIARIGFDVSLLTVEAMRDMLADPVARAKLTMKDLAVAHGIVTQNAQLLAGGVTARLDYGDKTPAPGHDDYERFVASLKNVTATGSSATTPATKEGAPGDAAAPIEVSASSPSDSPKTLGN